MKKKLLIFVVILLTGCDYYDDSLKITNKTKMDIAVQETNRRDSIYFNNIEYYLSNTIVPDSTINLSTSGKLGAWRRKIENSPEKEIFIYIFAVDTLRKYQGKKTMYDLFSQDRYIKRFEFSEKQLNDNNWDVVFDAPENYRK